MFDSISASLVLEKEGPEVRMAQLRRLQGRVVKGERQHFSIGIV
jgi:hypothetical protein